MRASFSVYLNVMAFKVSFYSSVFKGKGGGQISPLPGSALGHLGLGHSRSLLGVGTLASLVFKLLERKLF